KMFFQALEDCGDTTGPVQGLHGMGAAGEHVTDMRDLISNTVEIRKREWDLSLGCDCHEMKHGIGRTAERHIHADRIFQALSGNDITRRDILFYERNNSLAALPCYSQLCCVDCGNRCAAG